MHNYDSGLLVDPVPSGPVRRTGGRRTRKHSIFSLIVMIVVVAAIAAVGLTITFWALGFMFHLAGWILRVAVLAAVAAYVWRRVNRRWSHDRL